MKSRGMFGLSVMVFAIGASAAEISGVVTGPKGPEAGVWVIAETTDLPTKFAKVVVRRPRPLSDPRASAGELQRLGAGLRPGRFEESKQCPRQNPEPEGGGSAERE